MKTIKVEFCDRCPYCIEHNKCKLTDKLISDLFRMPDWCPLPGKVYKRKVFVSFELKMTNIGSWNGKWTGEGKRYIIVKSLSKDIVAKIFGDKNFETYHHSWGDGWGCNIIVMKIDSDIKNSFSKEFKNGFCGYEWMVDNIISHQSAYSKEDI